MAGRFLGTSEQTTALIIDSREKHAGEAAVILLRHYRNSVCKETVYGALLIEMLYLRDLKLVAEEKLRRAQSSKEAA